MKIQIYLNQLQDNLDTGQAKEHTHRAALEQLIETLAPSINAINEPVRIACGSPDFVILTKENNTQIGYIEAKDIGISLDNALKTEQLQRYVPALNNLILTDYLNFRWFVEGQEREDMRVTLAKIDKNGKLIANEQDFSLFEQLINEFINTLVISINNPDDLAQRMAKIAVVIKDSVLRTYQHETKNGALHGQLDSFRQVLLDELQSEQFADMYAQTVCYGLFAARCHIPDNKSFSRINAAYFLPKTNPFLQNLFDMIVGIHLDKNLIWAVENLTETLKRVDIAAILADFGKSTRQEDPVVHFYETFLRHYNPQLREMRGVYYTPEPVVSYIVRSVDLLLQQKFDLKDGLADSSQVEINGKIRHKVQILDPAVGTGTFLYAIVNKIYEKFSRFEGMWADYVHQHLLPRLHGFELLIAPYTVAHMKLGILLQEKGYDFQHDERLQLFLTNTLDEPREVANTLLARWLSDEAQAANQVKQDIPVMIIIGNPPYSGHSINKGQWIKQLIEDYKKNCPELSKPAQAKWLQDDYVKFIRFSQWRIEQTGYGILGFITNHSYLDNPTFRGMRQSLLKSFDEIYIYDLHGNSKKKEQAPDGSPDHNVFDIQQGVAIGIFVKHASKKQEFANVYYADLYGDRESKYELLTEQDVINTNWQQITINSPFYLFKPQDVDLHQEYNKFCYLPDIMNQNGDPAPGIITTHDQFAISWSRDESISKVDALLDTENEAQARNLFRLCSQEQWNYNIAKNELKSTDWRKMVTKILYRPFDIRWTVYDANVAVHRRKRVMQHFLLGDNLGLITIRRSRSSEAYRTFFVANIIIAGATAISSLDINYFFPLYIYPSEKEEFLNGNGNGSNTPKPARKPNFSPEFIQDLEQRLKLQFISEGNGDFHHTISATDVFYYIYAIFHSPSYRKRYAEFLKMDFPRLPIIRDKNLFQKLAKLGGQLVEIHLMQADINNDCGYPKTGNNIVDKLYYDEKQQRIYINKIQYFDQVKPEIWNFYIGGYQICQKWLKDRKGLALSFDDLKHYLYILAALEKTAELMQEIDIILLRSETILDLC